MSGVQLKRDCRSSARRICIKQQDLEERKKDDDFQGSVF